MIGLSLWRTASALAPAADPSSWTAVADRFDGRLTRLDQQLAAVTASIEPEEGSSRPGQGRARGSCPSRRPWGRLMFLHLATDAGPFAAAVRLVGGFDRPVWVGAPLV